MTSLKIKSIESLLKGIGVAALPGEKLTVMVGDMVRVHLTVEYRGPAIDGAVWMAIGSQDTWFDEFFASRTPVHFDASIDFMAYGIACDVLIGNRPGPNFDMYAKIMEVPGADIFTDVLLNVIDVIGAAEFQNFAIASYEKI